MPSFGSLKDLSSKLLQDITRSAGNIDEEELSKISSEFDDSLNDALSKFNLSTFDDAGFARRLNEIDLGDSASNRTVKDVLESFKKEYIDPSNLNRAEILLRRDLFNICTQMPEMALVIDIIRDAIIECNVSTGEVSRKLGFHSSGTNDSEKYLSQIRELEKFHDLPMMIKNSLIPKTLMVGENYIHVVPYSRLFAQIDSMSGYHKKNKRSQMNESASFSNSLYSESNMALIMEAVNDIPRERGDSKKEGYFDKRETGADVKYMLENITISNDSSSLLMEEYGVEGVNTLLRKDMNVSTEQMFTEYTDNVGSRLASSVFSNIVEDDVDYKSFKDINGCYLKYLDPLRVLPIRLDRKIAGYYYVTTTMDLTTNPTRPNGIVDLSFQNYMKDKELVDRLSNIIIRSFDKPMLMKNIKLKNEIAQIVMAHKFGEGRLSFIYIPEDEMVRFVINEDEVGRGHGIIERTLFPARTYLMLDMYNLLFTLNNTATRVHYLKASGLKKNYQRTIQALMRKIQSRRITIDDVYSYHGVLNKIGGIGEMIMPVGKGDYKPMETDTIEPVQKPIDTEFLELKRKQTVSGSPVPQLMANGAIDEVDFAKTLEMANARLISAVSGFKIDFNNSLTKLYKKIISASIPNIPDSTINSFYFAFNPVSQQELSINNDMIANFNTMFELVSTLYYSKNQLEDQNGNPTATAMHLRRHLAKRYLPQLNFDELDDLIKSVDVDAIDKTLSDRVANIDITADEVDSVT